jgi:hypothetical protein
VEAYCFQADRREPLTRVQARYPVWTRLELAREAQDDFRMRRHAGFNSSPFNSAKLNRSNATHDRRQTWTLRDPCVYRCGRLGEVYRARDMRLDRIVAIKTAHERFTERFEREARSIAALNHPNICQLYDVGPDYHRPPRPQTGQHSGHARRPHQDSRFRPGESGVREYRARRCYPHGGGYRYQSRNDRWHESPT